MKEMQPIAPSDATGKPLLDENGQPRVWGEASRDLNEAPNWNVFPAVSIGSALHKAHGFIEFRLINQRLQVADDADAALLDDREF